MNIPPNVGVPVPLAAPAESVAEPEAPAPAAEPEPRSPFAPTMSALLIDQQRNLCNLLTEMHRSQTAFNQTLARLAQPLSAPPSLPTPSPPPTPLAAYTQLCEQAEQARAAAVRNWLAQTQFPGLDNQQLRALMLMQAASEGRCDLIDDLLQAGATPNSANLSGNTPLHFAAHSGHTAAVRKLIRAGANPMAAAHDGTTARMLAQRHQHADALAVLHAAEAHHAELAAAQASPSRSFGSPRAAQAKKPRH